MRKENIKWQEERVADRVKSGGNGRGNGKGEQGTGLTYMRWEGLQGGETLLWVRGFPFRVIGLEAWAGLIHWYGPTGPRRLSAFRGWGAGGVGVVWSAGGLINIGCDLPPERRVLALQRLKLEETVSNTRGALSKKQAWFPGLIKHLLLQRFQFLKCYSHGMEFWHWTFRFPTQICFRDDLKRFSYTCLKTFL